MKTLLSERYAPITSSIGYLHLDFDAAVAALTDWLREITPGGIGIGEIDLGFPNCLGTLQPLTAGATPRYLPVETSSGWTAYFNCYLYGTDAASPIGHTGSLVIASWDSLASSATTAGPWSKANAPTSAVAFAFPVGQGANVSVCSPRS